MGTSVLPSIFSAPHSYHGRVVHGHVVTAWLPQLQALEPRFSMSAPSTPYFVALWRRKKTFQKSPCLPFSKIFPRMAHWLEPYGVSTLNPTTGKGHGSTCLAWSWGRLDCLWSLSLATFQSRCEFKEDGEFSLCRLPVESAVFIKEMLLELSLA